MYAPTEKAPPSIKQKFYEDLQDTLNLVPLLNIHVLLGKFNAWVGKRNRSNNLWENTLGYYGLDDRNEPWEEFLQLCSINNLSVINTSFQKKGSSFGYVNAPCHKRLHTIDYVLYVVICTNQSKLCNDVQVVGRADCWSDHLMVGPNWTSNCHSPKALSFIWRRPMATSRCTFWLVLEKVGVPPKILNIITSIHDHMLAVVRVRNMTTESISVQTGSDRGAC